MGYQNDVFYMIADCNTTDWHKMYNFKLDILLNVLNVQIVTLVAKLFIPLYLVLIWNESVTLPYPT